MMFCCCWFAQGLWERAGALSGSGQDHVCLGQECSSNQTTQRCSAPSSSFLLFSVLEAASITYKWSWWVNALIWKIIKPTLSSYFADVGFKVGGDTRINYFVLQIHYGDVNNFRGKHSNTADPEITHQYCEISMSAPSTTLDMLIRQVTIS